MNIELIKTFNEKATAYANAKSSNFTQEEIAELQQLKLIELIVNECANLCHNFKFTNEGPSEGAAYQRALCEIAIKEHFGLISKGPITHKVIR